MVGNSPSSGSVQGRVHQALESLIQSIGKEEADPVDVLRVVQREASLLFQSERVRAVLLQDPTRQLFRQSRKSREDPSDEEERRRSQSRRRRSSSADHRRLSRSEHLLETLCRTVRVVDFDKVITKAGYVRIEADVHIPVAAAAASEDDVNGSAKMMRSKKDPKRRRTAATPHQVLVGKASYSPGPSKQPSSWDAPGGAALRFCYERTGKADHALRWAVPLDDRAGEGCAGHESSDGPATILGTPCYVSYTIDYCRLIVTSDPRHESGCSKWGSEPLQRLLWVSLVAPSGVPSSAGAKMLGEDDDDEDDNDLWSGLEDDGRIDTEQDTKGKREDLDDSSLDDRDAPRKTLYGTDDSVDEVISTKQQDDQIEETAKDDDADVFAAGIDPDVLDRFLEAAGLNDGDASSSPASRCIVDHTTALFFLMSFPFYEHEWDLVGFVLDAVFGSDSDSDRGSEDDAGSDEDSER